MFLACIYPGIRKSLRNPGIILEFRHGKPEVNKIIDNELFPEDGIDFFRFAVKNDYLLIFTDYMEVCL